MHVTFEGLSLPVTDLDRSIHFYETLGFTTEVRSSRFALLRQGGGTIGLLRVGALDPGMPRRTRALVQVELSVPDLDGFHQELSARGVAVGPPRDRGFERQIQLKDPDGFTVEFAEGRRGK
jgi:catechol 2,3-dioxygenase-like lactoylglutathione lyase family enzyme